MAIILLAACLAAAIILMLYGYRTAFYSPKCKRGHILGFNKLDETHPEDAFMAQLMQEMESTEYRMVSTTAKDGLKLNARYYHCRDGAPMHIQFHGYRGSITRDACGGGRIAKELGFNTIIVEQRAHGGSDATAITFGIRERYDCLCWIEYAIKMCGEELPIFISGISMGAATVLMASELQLPKNVKAIMADSPYSSPEDIIAKVCREDMGLPPKICMPPLRLAAKLFGGFDLRQSSAEQAVKHTDIPILIIHGEADRFVPPAMAQRIARAAASPCCLVTFPGAEHGMAYIKDPQRYNRVLREFLAPLLPIN